MTTPWWQGGTPNTSQYSYCHVCALPDATQVFAVGVRAPVLFTDDSSAPTLVWDNNAAYDVTNSRFTAPREGYYRLSLTLRLTKSAGGSWTAGAQFNPSIYKNGVTFLWEGGNSPAWAATTSQINVNCSAVVKLAAGDYVQFSGTSSLDNMTVSSGYLHIDELP